MSNLKNRIRSYLVWRWGKLIETRYNRYQFSIEPSLCPNDISDNNRHNIVLVVMDSVRADSFSSENCPNIFNLCKNGMKFTRAYASANWTLPSHTSMLTGLYPSEHGAVRRQFLAYRPTHEYLPNRLRQMGYWNQGIVRMNFLHPKFGLGFAFDAYQQHSLATAADIFAQCQTSTEPFFIFINLGDTHSPFVCPSVLEKICDGERNRAYNFNRLSLNDDYFTNLRIQQDSCLQYIDSQIPSLIESLPTGTRFIFTSDHGELFGEESQFGHSGLLNTKVLHVPLMTNFQVRCDPEEIISINEIYSLVLGQKTTTGWAVAEHFGSPSFQHPRDILRKSMMFFWKEYKIRWRRGDTLNDDEWDVIQRISRQEPELYEQLMKTFTAMRQKNIVRKIKLLEANN